MSDQLHDQFSHQWKI